MTTLDKAIAEYSECVHTRNGKVLCQNDAFSPHTPTSQYSDFYVCYSFDIQSVKKVWVTVVAVDDSCSCLIMTYWFWYFIFEKNPFLPYIWRIFKPLEALNYSYIWYTRPLENDTAIIIGDIARESQRYTPFWLSVIQRVAVYILTIAQWKHTASQRFQPGIRSKQVTC